MDKREALAVLGLGEDAGPESVEQRYSILLKRMRNGEDLDGDTIDAAYDTLTGRNSNVTEESRFSRAVGRFLFHYKGWVILAVIVLAVLAIIIYPIANRRVPDLTVSMAGEYGSKNLDEFDEYLQQMLPDTEDILVEVMYLDKDGDSGEFDTGGRTRLTALLVTNDADILIADDSTFNYIRQDDALMSLDEIIAYIGLDIEKDKLIYGIDFKTGEKRVYGISVAENELVSNAIYGDERRILCIAEQTQHLDVVREAVKIILKDRSE